MAYADFKDLIKYYVIKPLILLRNPKYDEYQKGLASIVYKLFIREVLLQWFINFLITSPLPVVVLKIKILKN